MHAALMMKIATMRTAMFAGTPVAAVGNGMVIQELSVSRRMQ